MDSLEFKRKLKLIVKFLIILLTVGFLIFSSSRIRMFILQLAGGLSVFLFGMTMMTEKFEILAGPGIKKIFEKFTGNRFAAFISGIIVTAIIQSSSVTTVMVVGFVNSGLLVITQAIGVIIGANIGTTITGQLIAFKISKYAYVFTISGILLILISKNKRRKLFGQALVGFGLLFIGLSVMKSAVAPLKSSPYITKLIATYSQNIMAGVICGTIFTLILQSSSATVGITMAIAGAGLINFETAVALILGDNIGTTITALLASIPGNRQAKRAALAHSFFNILGAGIIICIFPYYLKFVQYLSGNVRIERLIANSHTFFNVINALIFLPFVNVLSRICYLFFPKSKEEKFAEKTYLDKRLLAVPALALLAVKKELIGMVEIIDKSMSCMLNLLKKFSYEECDEIVTNERMIDSKETDILYYLEKIEEKDITKSASINIIKYLHIADDLERIGDQIENVKVILTDKFERKIEFSNEDTLELDKLLNKVYKMFELARQTISEEDLDSAKKIYLLEDEVNKLVKHNRKKHVDRIFYEKSSYSFSYFYVDIMEKLERIGDHCVNIADAITGNL